LRAIVSKLKMFSRRGSAKSARSKFLVRTRIYSSSG
jgi:hypothetical protein